MKKLRKMSREYYLRQIVACWLVICMMFVLPARVAIAEVVMTTNPVGAITVTPLDSGTTQDMTATHGSIGNFSDFDIAGGHVVTCVQPDTTSQAMFRVSGNGTEIFGTFNANGGIWLIDPAGILVGGEGAINVNSLVASSLSISDTDFTNGLTSGVFPFANGMSAKGVTNYGSITAERIALIGKTVANRGTLTANNYVIMAAGDSVLISENSPVVVEVSMPDSIPDYYVDNGSGPHSPGDGEVAADHVILAAGDIWSSAIEGVETLRAEAKGNFTYYGDAIEAYAGPGSDAVADVTIITGGDLEIDYDIKAEAVGDGVFDAIATVTIDSDGNININDGLSFSEELDTYITAEAYDGLNNIAKVDIKAEGDVTITSNNDDVKIYAQAAEIGESANLNQAETLITGRNVTIENANIWDYSGDWTDPAVVGAYAYDAVENRAKVSITANGEEENGNVLLKAADKLGETLVEALACEGSENHADVVINATGNVDVSAEKANARIAAEARGHEEEYALLNEANVDITAGGNVYVNSKGGSSCYGFTPYVASIEAAAEYASNSNAANVNITAGGDVVVTSENGGQAMVEAFAGHAQNPELTAATNTANVNITTEDGYVLVHANGGFYNRCGHNFTPSEASIEAAAMYAGYEEEATDSSNTANITILAQEIPDEFEEEGDFIAGDVGVIGENGGKVEVEAKALYGDNSSADVDITADGDVKVLAECFERPSQAEITALAKYAANSSAGVGITADGDVKVIAKDGGKAEIEAIAKEAANTNVADITIDAGGDVKAIALGGFYSGDYTRSSASIKATTEYADEKNTSNVTITAFSEDCEDCDNDVKVIAKNGGKAEISAEATKSLVNNANVKIGADGEVKVIAKGYGSGPSSEAEIEAIAKNEGSYAHFTGEFDPEVGAVLGGGAENTANVDITALNVEVKAEDSAKAEITALAKNGIQIDNELGLEIKALDITLADMKNNASVTITANGDVTADYDTGNVWVTSECGGKAGIEAKAKNDISHDSGFAVNLTAEGPIENTANVVIKADDDVEVTYSCSGGEAEIEAVAENQLYDDSPMSLILTGSASNTAGIDITAGDNVEVISTDYGTAQIRAIAENYVDIEGDEEITGEMENSAGVNVNAGCGVLVQGDNGYAYIEAIAVGAVDNTADVTVNAETDVKVIAQGSSGDADIEADAMWALNSNTANVDVTARDVLVTSEDGGDADLDAEAYSSENSNTANMTVNARRDVKVTAYGGNSEAEIEAEAYADGSSNTANTKINAGRDVDVAAKVGGYACIGAGAEDAYTSNTADNTINAGGNVTVKGQYRGANAEIYAFADPEIEGPDNTATITINTGGDVEVKGEHGGAEITAEACSGYNNVAKVAIDAGGDVKVLGEHGNAYIEAWTGEGVTNTSDVAIDADGDVEVRASGCDAMIRAEAGLGDENKANVSLGGPGHKIGGDVKVIAEHGNAGIEAMSQVGFVSNNADVLICTEGALEVLSGIDEETDGYPYAYINAIAAGSFEGTNTAKVGIGAVEGVLVKAENSGSSVILAGAYDGYTNNAETIVCTKSGVQVIDVDGQSNSDTAGIMADAIGGYVNDAYVGVCAVGDVIVLAGVDLDELEAAMEKDEIPYGTGGHATIRATAGSGYYGPTDAILLQSPDPYEGPLTANAESVVVSREGGVGVIDVSDNLMAARTAEITAEAFGAYENTASVGVAAGADLSPAFVAALPEDSTAGDVYVLGLGYGGNAQILAWAHDGAENTADTVVCAPGEVFVGAYSREEGLPSARIEALAGYPSDKFVSVNGNGESEVIYNATTQVYASDVTVEGEGARIAATIPGKCLTAEGKVALYDDGVTLIIGDYEDRQDCPECPACPCEEEVTELFAPVAALPLVAVPRVEGCPALIEAASAELGIPVETLQVAIGNALALNPSLQPCQACATLVDAAGILRDVDGSRMAAMVQAFNSLAPADVPFTPETAALIATAFETAAEDSLYASVAEYIDAFVQYVTVMDTQLGTPVDNSVAFVMGKYGSSITENDNANISNFIASRLATLETFGG